MANIANFVCLSETTPNESFLFRLLRRHIMGLACNNDNKECIQACVRRFQQWIDNPSRYVCDSLRCGCLQSLKRTKLRNIVHHFQHDVKPFNQIQNSWITIEAVGMRWIALDCKNIIFTWFSNFCEIQKVIQEKLNYLCIALECYTKKNCFLQTEIQFLQICVLRCTLMGFVKLEVSGNGKSCGIDTSALQQLKKRVTSSVPCQTQRMFGSSRGIFWRKNILPALMSKFFHWLNTKTNRTI